MEILVAAEGLRFGDILAAVRGGVPGSELVELLPRNHFLPRHGAEPGGM
jgi:hypothetical protein